MNRTWMAFALPVTALCAWVAWTPTATLAAWLTHPVVAERQGVDIRAVTLQGAHWWRIAAVACAASWWIVGSLIARAMPSRTVEHPAAGPVVPLTGRPLLIVGGLIALGVIERIWRITESFWYDEISALIDYAQHGPGPIIGTYFVQSNHVLHTLLSWCALTVSGGINEVILRTPALIAGILVIPATAWLLHETCLWMRQPSRVLPAASAAAAALAPIVVLESCEARGYSLMILCAATSTALLLRGMRCSSVACLMSCALVTALGIWSHLVFAGLPLGQCITLLLCIAAARRSGSALTTPSAALAVLSLGAVTAGTLLTPLLPDMLRIRREFAALDGNEPSLLSAEGLHLLLGLGGAWSWTALPACMLVCVGLFGALRDATRRVPLALMLLGLPLVAIGTDLGGSWMYARFGLFALPGCITALVLGANDILAWIIRRTPAAQRSIRRPLITAVLVLGVTVPWTVHTLQLPPKQPLRDAVEWVLAKEPTTVRLGTVGLADNVLAYYAVVREIEIVPTGPSGRDLDSLDADIRWLIVLYPRTIDENAATALERNWSAVRRLRGWVDWDNGDVIVYRRR